MHDVRAPNFQARDPAKPAPPPRREPRIELHIEPAPRDSILDSAGARSVPHKRLAFCYGLGGFMAGVAFWHGVGFWQLMHSTLYEEPAASVTRTSEPAPQLSSTAGTFADTIDRALSSAGTEEPPANIRTGAVAPGGKAAARIGGVEAGAASAGGNCASFIRDPATGEIRSRPCTDAERALPQNPGGGRQNLADGKPSSEGRWPGYMGQGKAD